MVEWLKKGKQVLADDQKRALKQAQERAREEKRREEREERHLRELTEPFVKVAVDLSIEKMLADINRRVWSGLGNITGQRTRVHSYYRGSYIVTLSWKFNSIVRRSAGSELSIESLGSRISVTVEAQTKGDGEWIEEIRNRYRVAVDAEATLTPIGTVPGSASLIPFPEPQKLSSRQVCNVEQSFFGGYQCPRLNDAIAKAIYLQSEKRALPQQNVDWAKALRKSYESLPDDERRSIRNFSNLTLG